MTVEARGNISASKRPITLCYGRKSMSGTDGGGMFFIVTCFFPLSILSSTDTVTPFACDLRRFQTAEEIHDSSFTQLSKFPLSLLLHIHHAHVRAQD